MNQKEKAEVFAIKAHDGKFRKADPEKPYVIHPIDVANKLKAYGFGDDVITAGYLHDVVEDTKYSLEDIENLFGKHVASLVKGASEQSKIDKTAKGPKKEASWEERKQETIDRIKGLDFEHKAVACADKISNLEDITTLSGKIGGPNFSSFKRGFEKQKWYYDNLYQSFIYGCDENLEMFQELKKLIELLFYTPFSKDYLSVLSYKKQELLKLRSIFDTKSPNLGNIYFKTFDKKTYNIISDKLERIGIQANVTSNNPSIIRKFPQISFDLNNKNVLSILIQLVSYGGIKHHNCSLRPKSYYSPEKRAELVIDTIMKEFYEDTLYSVKRKIREKKRISLD